MQQDDKTNTSENKSDPEKGSDVHMVKIVEQIWYERNKQSFPVNRWDMYEVRPHVPFWCDSSCSPTKIMESTSQYGSNKAFLSFNSA